MENVEKFDEAVPEVSVVIPIYNAEQFIRRALEALVFQTLENIEIICVNKGSTDGTSKILAEYREKFPQKVYVYDLPYTDTPSEGRRYGVEQARGEYIYHCDADDMISFDALKCLYEKAQKDECDMVLGYNKIVFENGEMHTQGRTNKSFLTNEEAMLLNGAYWVRIIKKSLIDEVGNVPAGMYCDDRAYIPVITSYAKKIGYVDKLVFYYYRKPNSVMTIPKLEVVEGGVAAEKWILENVNPEKKAAAEWVIGKHILNDLKARWQFNDITVLWLKDFMSTLSEDSGVYEDSSLFKELNNWYTGCSGNISKIIYINGFDPEFNELNVKQKFKNAFYDDFKIIILNEKNCSWNDKTWIQQALEAGEYDFVGKYFALKNIYETGGIFVSEEVSINNPLNYLTYLHAFFSYIDANHITDMIWGAEKGNPIINAIVNTYEEDSDVSFSLGDRIKNILVVELDVNLDGRSTLFKHPVSLFSPDVMVIETREEEKIDSSSLQMANIDFSQKAYNSEYCIVKKTTLEYLTPVNESAYAKLKRDLESYKKKLTNANSELKKQSKDASKWKSEADKWKSEVNKWKSEANKRKSEADKWKSEADKWKSETISALEFKTILGNYKEIERIRTEKELLEQKLNMYENSLLRNGRRSRVKGENEGGDI